MPRANSRDPAIALAPNAPPRILGNRERSRPSRGIGTARAQELLGDQGEGFIIVMKGARRRSLLQHTFWVTVISYAHACS